MLTRSWGVALRNNRAVVSPNPATPPTHERTLRRRLLRKRPATLGLTNTISVMVLLFTIAHSSRQSEECSAQREHCHLANLQTGMGTLYARTLKL
jgi:hypothetical protein